MTWKEKLHPRRFVGMSGKMAAIVGYLCEERYTDPAINELVVTSDGFVLVEHVGEVGTNNMIGDESDLLRNWSNLLDGAGLTLDERTEVEAAYQSHVQSFRVVEHLRSEPACGTQPARLRPATNL
jgi:Flp pilus assembly CpaF family ATPase